MIWRNKFASMQDVLIGDVIGYLEGNEKPEPVYLCYKPATVDPIFRGRNQWGALGFARGPESLQDYQKDGWQLAHPQGIRKDMPNIRDFILGATCRLPVIGH